MKSLPQYLRQRLRCAICIDPLVNQEKNIMKNTSAGSWTRFILTILVLCLPGIASAQLSFNSIVVLGTSVSDPGNAYTLLAHPLACNPDRANGHRLTNVRRHPGPGRLRPDERNKPLHNAEYSAVHLPATGKLLLLGWHPSHQGGALDPRPACSGRPGRLPQSLAVTILNPTP